MTTMLCVWATATHAPTAWMGRRSASCLCAVPAFILLLAGLFLVSLGADGARAQETSEQTSEQTSAQTPQQTLQPETTSPVQAARPAAASEEGGEEGGGPAANEGDAAQPNAAGGPVREPDAATGEVPAPDGAVAADAASGDAVPGTPDEASGDHASGEVPAQDPIPLPLGDAAENAEPPASDLVGPDVLDDPLGAIRYLFSRPQRGIDDPHDLSVVGMFRAADWVVKAVMVALIVASLMTWTIWLAKSVEVSFAKSRARRAVEVINLSNSLDEAADGLGGRKTLFKGMVDAAMWELDRSDAALDHAGTAGVKERVAARLSRIEAAAGRSIAQGTGILASVASTAPFVGLFGTVWGIMNAFIGISQAQTTNLAVVAPGIAEALLATGMGLFAAIPAVVMYNAFARSISGYRQLLADAASGVERLVSRDLDFRGVPGGSSGEGEAPAPELAAAAAE